MSELDSMAEPERCWRLWRIGGMRLWSWFLRRRRRRLGCAQHSGIGTSGRCSWRLGVQAMLTRRL